MLTSGNGIRQPIHGHKKQTLAELEDLERWGFLLAQKDTLEREWMVIHEKIFGNGIRQQTHGHKRQILEELQDILQQGFQFLSLVKDILEPVGTAPYIKMISGNGIRLLIYGYRKQILPVWAEHTPRVFP